MREFYNDRNKKLYYMLMLSIITLMIMGLLIDNPRFGHLELGYMLHIGLVAILSTCLLLYPKYETYVFRTIIILLGSVYFYMLFFLYPKTSSIFIFLCFIPAFSILFFEANLFYFSLLIAC